MVYSLIVYRIWYNNSIRCILSSSWNREVAVKWGMVDMLKKPPFYEEAVKAKAKIIDFHGWALALDYGSILNEAKSARQSVALFDVSHMGRIRVRGRGSLRLLQSLTSNDISSLKENQVQYNLFITEEGTIIDDFLVYNFGDNFLCVVNASNKDKDLNWIKIHRIDDVEIIDESDTTALLSLQGPKAYLVVEKILGRPVDSLKYMHFVRENIQGKPLIISRTGYTGEDGFELCFLSDDALYFWRLITQAGEEFDLKLAGLGARDILRIEAGYCLYGNEIDEGTNPFEACLGWVVKLEGKDFIGKNKLKEVISQGITRKRVGLVMEEKSVPRKGCPIYNMEGEKIGEVTSGSYSPNKNSFIGMGYVSQGFTLPRTPVKIKIREKLYESRVEKLPFVPYRHK